MPHPEQKSVSQQTVKPVFCICRKDNMEECRDVCGGMSLSHSVVDGKHQYEVENCLTYESHCFARKRDKVLMINNVETQYLPPAEFVLMLKSDSLMLTLHGASTAKENLECLESDTLQMCAKKNAVLSFNLVMVQEESLEEDEETSQNVEEELETSDIEDDFPLEGNVLLVSMTKTSVLCATGWDYDQVDHACDGCTDMGCSFNRVVVTSEKCKVMTVSTKYIKVNEKGRVFIQSLLNTAITSETVKRTCCRSYSTSDITIHYYHAVQPDFNLLCKGIPVVLNFTGSKNFLKCTTDKAHPNKPAILSIECCDQTDLQHICKDDPATWPFVFYMSTSKSNCRRFESAAHSGWFIHTKNPDTVDVAEKTNKSLTEDSFYFFIHLKSS